MAETRPPVGIVGTGRMGLAVVAQLTRRGFVVHAYDREPEALRKASEHGARISENLSQLAARSDVALLSLPSDDSVREVVQGAGGLLSTRGRVKIVLDLSTVSPGVSKENAGRSMAAGIRYVDATVIGGAGNCGEWSILVGGSDDAIGQGVLVLEALGRPHYLGRLGAGNSLKLLNNLMLAVLASTAREMVALSRAAGIEPETMCRVLGSTGSVTLSRFLTELLPRVLAGEQAGNFSLGLLQKDATLAFQLATELGVDVPTLEAARQAIAAAGERLDPSTDFTEILRPEEGPPTP